MLLSYLDLKVKEKVSLHPVATVYLTTFTVTTTFITYFRVFVNHKWNYDLFRNYDVNVENYSRLLSTIVLKDGNLSFKTTKN